MEIYFDGGTALNSICIHDYFGEKTLVEYIDTEKTSNQLEYLALIKAVKYVNSLDDKISRCSFIGDSRLVICQMNKTFKIKNNKLRYLNKEIISLLKTECYDAKFKWVPREQNLAGVHLEEILNKKRCK